MLKALRNRSLALLWGGQAASAIGDEIYRVALIWMAVNLIGADTGYLAAGQSAALLAFSLLGGCWSDRWDILRTLIGVDLLRALVVLAPVVIAQYRPLSMPILWGVALTLSAMSAFFEPALQATLPGYARDTDTLQAANGLMSTTSRMARAIGPGIIGALSAFVPMIHFFTLDALTFFVSALSIGALRAHPGRCRKIHVPAMGFRQASLAGFRLVRGDATLRYILFAKAVAGGTWNLAYSLGFALLMRQIAPGDMRAFSAVIAAYGAGNLMAALWFGNLRRPRPARLLFGGYVWMGAGFLGVACAPNIPCLVLASAFTAVGGPMNDLPFIDIVQARFAVTDIPKICRLRMALETGASLLCLLVSPLLFRWLPAQVVIGLCGLVTLAVGAAGLARAAPTVPVAFDQRKAS